MATYDANKSIKDKEVDKFVPDSNGNLAVNTTNPQLTDLVNGDSNIPVIEGSKSGSTIFQEIMAYDSNHNIEYIGEAAQGAATNTESWYIEKLSYDANFNMTNIKVASNELYSGAGTINIDKDINSPNITITINTADYSLLEVGDTFDLTTATNSNLIVGPVVDITSNVIQITINSPESVVNESSTAINSTDLKYTLNSSLINKKVWDFRTRYVYK